MSLELRRTPRACASEVPAEEVNEGRAKRRLKIELRDLKKYGFSDGCPKCQHYRHGRQHAAQRVHALLRSKCLLSNANGAVYRVQGRLKIRM